MQRSALRTALRPLTIDLAIPLGTYYLLRDALGLSLWLSPGPMPRMIEREAGRAC